MSASLMRNMMVRFFSSRSGRNRNRNKNKNWKNTSMNKATNDNYNKMNKDAAVKEWTLKKKDWRFIPGETMMNMTQKALLEKKKRDSEELKIIQKLKNKTLADLGFYPEEEVLIIGDEDMFFTHILSKVFWDEDGSKIKVRLATPTPKDGRWPERTKDSNIAYDVKDLDAYLKSLEPGTKFHKVVMVKPLPGSKTNKNQEDMKIFFKETFEKIKPLLTDDGNIYLVTDASYNLDLDGWEVEKSGQELGLALVNTVPTSFMLDEKIIFKIPNEKQYPKTKKYSLHKWYKTAIKDQYVDVKTQQVMSNDDKSVEQVLKDEASI
ncbi:hypothetical protein QVD17_15454 [Tagetes erecta]|uniref:Uncharacterized protein n=1 Tax=Tagetes erecta TaxID=13708 RepID=A0AAD8KQ03_TARER|nr:hypothetical protein QVD17_15454 [Tagetes erecta]